MYPCTHPCNWNFLWVTHLLKKITYRNIKLEAGIPVTRSWSAANPQAMKWWFLQAGLTGPDLRRWWRGARCSSSCCLVNWDGAFTRWADRCHNDPLKNNRVQYNIAGKRGETMAADGQKPGSQQAGRGSSFIAKSSVWRREGQESRPVPNL